MKETTLDELIQNVREKEAQSKESDSVLSQFKQTCAILKNVAKEFEGEDKKVRILTDYDADGICSAMIMKRTLECMNQNLNIEVVCNDRRGSYGVPKDVKGEPDTQDIILDMGSNELGYIQAELGQSGKNPEPIVIDHHQIDSDIARKQFRDNPRYLNPHCITEANGGSAEYCATGLAYRCFQELANDGAFTIPYDEKIDRTVAIYAAIGTVTDVMPLLDPNSNNRDIMKQGIEYIDTANPDNTDYILGAMLETVNISEHTTAHEIAYNAGAYLNAASRMSEITQTNGAQQMFDMLASNPINDLGREPDSKTDFALEDFQKLNELKKAIVQCVMKSDEYQKFEQEHQSGESRTKGVAVFIVPEDLPMEGKDGNSLTLNGEAVGYAAAMNGLVAGKAEDSLDKGVIILSKKGDEYVGSGRAPEGYDSLNAFVTMAMKEEGLSEDVKFGGHAAAIGISAIPADKIEQFVSAIDKYAEDFQKTVQARPVLKLTANEMSNPDLFLQKVQALEPIGQGNQLPPVVVEGVEQRKTQGFKAGNPKWKTITIKTDTKGEDGKPIVMTATDWNYPTYPSGDKDKIAVLADVGISQFRGTHVELTVRMDSEFARERFRSLEAEKAKPKQTGKTGKD